MLISRHCKTSWYDPAAVAALACRHEQRGRGAKIPKCHLAPTVKHTGQQSGSELCEIFKLWSFLQQKLSAKCKLLQLLSDPLPGLYPWAPLGYLRPQKWELEAPPLPSSIGGVNCEGVPWLNLTNRSFFHGVKPADWVPVVKQKIMLFPVTNIYPTS